MRQIHPILLPSFAFLTFMTAVRAADLPQHTLQAVPIQQVAVDDSFWSPKLKVWREVTIPDCLTKFEKDGALTNFDKIRDGAGGDHFGPPWYDGLIYEMIRGTSDFLAEHPDAALEARIDGYIARIAAAQAKDPDGYLDSYTQLKEPTHRWGQNGGKDTWQHDCYNAGALIEAGVHYYRATGKTQLLEVAVRLANGMSDLMGPPPRKNIVPGHALGEEALVNLYLLFHEQPGLKSKLGAPVKEEDYLRLAQFWIESRGHHEGRVDFGAYAQDEKPILECSTIEGHAVRAALLCTGLAAAGNVNHRDDYLNTSLRLWNNMAHRREYITGGLGTMSAEEKFAPDYVLPNDGYLETCAAVGGAFFDNNMNLAFADARFADELERELFNGALVGTSLKGDRYFYDNPLDVAQKHERWAWHPCPCCPPMFLKLMGGLPGYIYATDSNTLYINQFIGNRATATVNGAHVQLRMTTKYPWDGRIKIEVEPEHPADFAVEVRLPSWCHEPRVAVNGKSAASLEPQHGYARIEREWDRKSTIEVTLPMAVECVTANPMIDADRGRIALQRGPVVYCAEAIDNHGHVRSLAISPKDSFTPKYHGDLLGGVTVIEGTAYAEPSWTNNLYAPAIRHDSPEKVHLTAIPYFANANREPGEMSVWLLERQ